MAQLAVFDKFYPGPNNPEPSDVVGMALASGEHEVVAHANTIEAGALAIAAMSEDELATPDVVIVGGRLEDDGRYLRQPATVTKTVDIPGKTFLGNPKVTSRSITTTLLPVPDAAGKMVLPTSYKSPVKPRQVREFAAELDDRFMEAGRAAYILAHLVKVLLPENVKIIGVSSFNDMGDLPVAAFINRMMPNRRANAEQLRRTIAELITGDFKKD